MQRLRLAKWLAPLVLTAACAAGGGGDVGSGPPAVGNAEEPVASDDPRAPSRLVQPGAPGQATRTIDSSDLDELGGVAWTEADVHFMQMMIPHHAQALEMTALVDRHATTEAVRRMALRMEISQRDEIALMERWLRERDQEVMDWRAAMEGGVAQAMTTDDSMVDHAGHDMGGVGPDGGAGGGMAGMAPMPGMLTAEQMDALAAARGPDFDRLFLQSMIQHHQGAIVMVRDLFTARGGGQESEIFQFASHVDADQTAEIERMRGILESLR